MGVKIYMIVDEDEITTAMINRSTSSSISDMPHKNSGGIDYRIIEANTNPPNDVFNGFVWHDSESVKAEWDALP